MILSHWITVTKAGNSSSCCNDKRRVTIVFVVAKAGAGVTAIAIEKAGERARTVVTVMVIMITGAIERTRVAIATVLPTGTGRVRVTVRAIANS